MFFSYIRFGSNTNYLFRDEEKCENELRKNFITHKHYPESKMQIVELAVKIDGIKDI